MRPRSIAIDALLRGFREGLAEVQVTAEPSRADLERELQRQALVGLQAAQDSTERNRAIQAGAAALKALPEAKSGQVERPTIQVNEADVDEPSDSAASDSAAEQMSH